MTKPDKNLKLPGKFLEQYRKNIALRTAGSIALLGIGAFLCTVIDFSSSKYPEAGMAAVMFVFFYIGKLAFGFDRILFRRSWMGKIAEINATKERRVKVWAQSHTRKRLIVHLMVDRGEGSLYDCELWHEGTEHSGERTEEGAKEAIPENKYYTYAPFKVDDTIVYLRGMKYPFRYNVQTEGMFDVLFVCPYCGEINKADREDCYHCRRTLVK